MTIQALQEELLQRFSMLESWIDRYEMIIEMGKDLPPLDDSEKIPQNLIDGCQSRLWIVAKEKDGKLLLKADSDALIVKGIAAMLLFVLNDQPVKEIVKADLFFIERLGLRTHLSPTRSNGLFSMIIRIKKIALEILKKEQEEGNVE